MVRYKIYNEKLVSVCNSRGVEWIDTEKGTPKNTSAFYDGVHFNENGSNIVANIIFDFLKKKPLLN